jgi:predicted nucleic acid-binding protein
MSASRRTPVTGDFWIDSNVLMYSTLASDPRYARAREVLEWRLIPGNRAFISVQNLSEMYPNLTGPKTQPPDSPAQARAKIAAIAALSALTIVPITRSVVEKALEISERLGLTRQTYYDAQIAAAMGGAGVTQIVTENAGDFKNIPGLRAIQPFENL